MAQDAPTTKNQMSQVPRRNSVLERCHSAGKKNFANEHIRKTERQKQMVVKTAPKPECEFWLYLYNLDKRDAERMK